MSDEYQLTDEQKQTIEDCLDGKISFHEMLETVLGCKVNINRRVPSLDISSSRD